MHKKGHKKSLLWWSSDRIASNQSIWSKRGGIFYFVSSKLERITVIPKSAQYSSKEKNPSRYETRKSVSDYTFDHQQESWNYELGRSISPNFHLFGNTVLSIWYVSSIWVTNSHVDSVTPIPCDIILSCTPAANHWQYKTAVTGGRGSQSLREFVTHWEVVLLNRD